MSPKSSLLPFRLSALIFMMSVVLAAPVIADECYDANSSIPGYQEIQAMRSGPPPVLWIEDESLNDYEEVQLHLALNAAGGVTCVRFEFGQERLKTQALALAARWRFKPYRVDGKPVAASFGQRVDVRWRSPRPSRRAAFPVVRDLATLRIRLETDPGYMGCIGTNIEIAGDGTLIFEAEYRRAGSLTEWGQVRETARLTPRDVQSLVERFRLADFFWLHDSYTGDKDHSPYGWISIAFDGYKKRIRYEDGRAAGMPSEVMTLQEEIERLADRNRRAAGLGCL